MDVIDLFDVMDLSGELFKSESLNELIFETSFIRSKLVQEFFFLILTEVFLALREVISSSSGRLVEIRLKILEVEFKRVEDWVDWLDEVRSFDLAGSSSLDISLSLLSKSISFFLLFHLDELFSNLNKLDSKSLVNKLLDERVLLEENRIEELLEFKGFSNFEENFLSIFFRRQFNKSSLSIEITLVILSLDLRINLVSKRYTNLESLSREQSLDLFDDSVFRDTFFKSL